MFNQRDRAKWDAWKAVEGNFSECLSICRNSFVGCPLGENLHVNVSVLGELGV